MVLEVGAGTVVLGAPLAGQLYVATLTPAEGHIAHTGQTPLRLSPDGPPSPAGALSEREVVR